MGDIEMEDMAFTGEQVLEMFVDKLDAGTALMPMPKEFLEDMKAKGHDPQTSLTFFYLKLVDAEGNENRFLFTVEETIMLQLAAAEYIQGSLDQAKRRLDDD